jgi:hypothetical protein
MSPGDAECDVAMLGAPVLLGGLEREPGRTRRHPDPRHCGGRAHAATAPVWP